jgi:uncharacterized membrane protein
MVSKRRSLAKSITWRLIAIFVTFGVGFVMSGSWEFVHLVIIAGVIYILTGEWEYATFGALIYIAWEALAYFIHERIWSKFVKIK